MVTLAEIKSQLPSAAAIIILLTISSVIQSR